MATTSTKIRAALLDGTVMEVRTRTFMCTADRVSFERRFDVSPMVMSKFQDAFDDDGKPKPGVDLSDLRDEHMAFFAYRVLKREGSKHAALESFDQFVEEVEDIEIDDSGAEGNGSAQAAGDVDAGRAEGGREDPLVPARPAG